MMNNPVRFLTRTGVPAYGYEATILPDLCDAVLAARKANELLAHQQPVAARCEILVRGFARVGIIALIDEATGYQEDRARNALAKILEAFVAKELQRWIRTFPTDFYRELFRLWKLPYNSENPSLKKPGVVGTLTNNIVYARLAPGVLEELRRKNARGDSGSRPAKHHQHLTRDVGHPRLLEHLAAVTALMRVSETKDQFMKMLDKALPKQTDAPLFTQPVDPPLLPAAPKQDAQ